MKSDILIMQINNILRTDTYFLPYGTHGFVDTYFLTVMSLFIERQGIYCSESIVSPD